MENLIAGVHSIDTRMKEITDRTRRIETRLTRYIEAQGVETGAHKPRWKQGGIVAIPTMVTSLADILGVIPKGYEGDVDLVFRGHVVASLYLPEVSTTVPENTND